MSGGIIHPLVSKRAASRILISAALIGALLGAVPARASQPAPPLRLVAVIPLPNVEGRIDHFTIDLKGRRLFMSALGNDTVEVFNLRTNRLLRTLRGLREPQGVTYAPDSNRIFVANGEDGKVRIFDGKTYKLESTLSLGSDADDTRYDAETRRVYVGYGDGGIAELDAATGKLLGTVKVPDHPEAFEVEKGGGKIYINIPDAREIAVADWVRRAIVARWPIAEYRANFPMALDARDHRLFVVTRRPPQFLALDAASGRMIAHRGAVGDADDIWYDAARKRIYISGGEGLITVIEQQDANHYRNIAKIPTAWGARTSFFSPQLGRLYLAVPRRGKQSAEVRVYEASGRGDRGTGNQTQ